MTNQPRKPKGTHVGGQFDRGAGGGLAAKLSGTQNAIEALIRGAVATKACWESEPGSQKRFALIAKRDELVAELRKAHPDTAYADSVTTGPLGIPVTKQYKYGYEQAKGEYDPESRTFTFAGEVSVTDHAPQAVLDDLPIRVTSQNRRSSFNEQYLGFNTIYSVTDYGEAWNNCDDEALLKEVRDSITENSTQLCNIATFDKDAGTAQIVPGLVVVLTKDGYSVRADTAEDLTLAQSELGYDEATTSGLSTHGVIDQGLQRAEKARDERAYLDQVVFKKQDGAYQVSHPDFGEIGVVKSVIEKRPGWGNGYVRRFVIQGEEECGSYETRRGAADSLVWKAERNQND
jgi:hypothetical protein